MKKIIKVIFTGLILSVSSALWAGHVNINTADAETLSSELKGIGAKKAQAIIDYRKEHGAFATMGDLENVKGISSKTIEKNKENIVLEKS
jgi:competence protein ComEA